MSWKWTPKMIRCADCGAETLANHNKTRFCPECRKRRDIEGRQRRYVCQKMKLQAEKPEEPDEREIHFCDTPENVQKCLNCEKPKCTNCLFYERTAKKKSKKYRVPEDMKERVISLVGQNISQRKMAEILGVSQSSVSKWISGLRWEGLL